MTAQELRIKIDQERILLKRILDQATMEKRDLTRSEMLDFDNRMLEVQKWELEHEQMLERSGDQVHLADYRPGRGMRDNDMFARPKRWAELFQRPPRSLSRKLTFTEFLKAVHDHDLDVLRELRTMNEGTGSEGGFSVPEQLWAQIWNAMVEVSVVMDQVRLFPMTSDTLKIPAWDSADQTQGSIAKIEPEWLGELGTATRKTPSLRLLTLTPNKIALYLQSSYEVLSDSVALSSSLGPLMTNSLAFGIDEAVLTGNGTARPLGVLESPAAINVGRATANSIGFADLTNMAGSLLPGSFGKAIWIFSPSAYKRLLAVEVATNSGVLALSTTMGAGAAPSRTLLGMEVRVSEKLPSLGTKGDAMLLDLSFYAFGSREVGRFEKTNAAGWTTDALDFRMIHRVDGKPLISTPIVVRKGGSTVSPFVILQ